jgi:hypothetical protein
VFLEFSCDLDDADLLPARSRNRSSFLFHLTGTTVPWYGRCRSKAKPLPNSAVSKGTLVHTASSRQHKATRPLCMDLVRYLSQGYLRRIEGTCPDCGTELPRSVGENSEWGAKRPPAKQVGPARSRSPDTRQILENQSNKTKATTGEPRQNCHPTKRQVVSRRGEVETLMLPSQRPKSEQNSHTTGDQEQQMVRVRQS